MTDHRLRPRALLSHHAVLFGRSVTAVPHTVASDRVPFQAAS